MLTLSLAVVLVGRDISGSGGVRVVSREIGLIETGVGMGWGEESWGPLSDIT